MLNTPIPPDAEAGSATRADAEATGGPMPNIAGRPRRPRISHRAAKWWDRPEWTEDPTMRSPPDRTVAGLVDFVLRAHFAVPRAKKRYLGQEIEQRLAAGSGSSGKDAELARESPGVRSWRGRHTAPPALTLTYVSSMRHRPPAERRAERLHLCADGSMFGAHKA